MSAAEKEELIIKLNDERRSLIFELKRMGADVKDIPSCITISKRLIEIDKQIKELTESEQSNCS